MEDNFLDSIGIREGARVLLVGAHPDDIELGMGATVLRLSKMGRYEFTCLIFSSCDENLPRSFVKGTLLEECKESLSILGIPEHQITFLDFPVRRFSEHRQDILQILVDVRIKAKIDVVFCPSSRDIHQDHSVVAEETTRSFKSKTVLGYELPWNNLSSKRDLFVALDEDCVVGKSKALASYISQQDRPYMSTEAQQSLARYTGLLIGTSYAEAFEVIRWVWN
jgi:LmbE family N-acetylglucosaminyl deacetylase